MSRPPYAAYAGIAGTFVAGLAAVSMPGSAPVVRLMMYPDGHKLGVERIAASVDNAIAALSAVVSEVDAAREKLLG